MSLYINTYIYIYIYTLHTCVWRVFTQSGSMMSILMILQTSSFYASVCQLEAQAGSLPK